MRIALVMAAPTTGGVYSHVRDLASSLDSRGHNVVVFAHEDLIGTLSGDLESLGEIEVRGLDEAVRADCDVWHLHLHNSFDGVSFRIQLRRCLRMGRGAIVLDEHLPRTPRSDSTIPWDPHIPSGRRKPFAKQLKTIFKRAQYRLADRVIVRSEASRRFLHDRYSLPMAKMELVRLGIPAPKDGVMPSPSDALRVLVLAVVCTRKGQDVLIEATRFARTRWEVHMVGDGPQLEEFEALASERAMQPVSFDGPTHDGPGTISSVDVVCVPSRYDNSPISAIEAMMLARPVVGSDVDGVPEIVVDGETGLIVPSEDPRSLAEALDALADPELRSAMGARAKDRASRTHSLDRMVDRTLEVYRAASV